MLALARAYLVLEPAMVYIEVVFDTDKTGHTINLQGMHSPHNCGISCHKSSSS